LLRYTSGAAWERAFRGDARKHPAEAPWLSGAD
jgi:hypothetical protein